MLQSFPYIANEQTRGIIIGSMPGEASLAAGEYYAHPQNFFWKFLYAAFGEVYTPRPYEEKVEFLLAHRLGLWDAAAACEREGSLDTDIRNAEPNDFMALFLKYPHITCLLFNGHKAHQLFIRHHKRRLAGREAYLLPSTSPANASVPLAAKKAEWIAALRLAAATQ